MMIDVIESCLMPLLIRAVYFRNPLVALYSARSELTGHV